MAAPVPPVQDPAKAEAGGLTNMNRNVPTRARALRRLAVAGVVAGMVVPTVANAAISGTAFRDYDADGTRDAREPGITGIAVTALDDAGAVVATATTAADGTYSLTGVAAGARVRVEFSGEASFLKQGGNGLGAGSSVQFASEGDTDVNHGLNNPAEFCEANPQIAAACSFFGRYDSDFAAKGGLRVFGFNTTGLASERAGSDPALAPTSASFGEIGSTYGLAFQKSSRSLFAAAFYKRGSGFGPGGPGAIYRVVPGADQTFGTADDTVSTFLDLGAAAGPDLHPTAATSDSSWVSDAASWAPVGKSSLGDIDLSDDGQTMYVMNLYNRKLYIAPIGAQPTAPAAGTIREIDVPDPGTECVSDPSTPAGQLNLNVRPFAVGYQDGHAYVGVTCTGESSASIADVKAFVYRFDDPGFTQVLQVPLNYTRAGSDMPWYPWTDATTGPQMNDWAYGEPFLADLEWDGEDLILGLRDRRGDQAGYGMSDLNGGFAYIAATGDILRACRADAASEVYLTESNGSSPAGCRRAFGPGAGVGNNQGPSGGEFYGDAAYGFHDDVPMGGLAQVPGATDVIASLMDPNQLPGESLVNSNGVRRMSNVDGAPGTGLELTANCETNCQSQDEGGFGKANGIGDLEALCQSAPIEIGNRVWLDDGDGVQDPSESPAAGVTVRLFDAAGNLVATTTTDAEGRYLFSSAGPDLVPGNGDDLGGYGSDGLPNTSDDTTGLKPNQSYSIRLDNPADYSGAGALAGRVPTVTGATAAGGSVINDSNGVAASATDVRANVTTGEVGVNDHRIDFGFVLPASLGDKVWYDDDTDGIQDAGESGVAGVKVILRDTAGNPIATTTTAADGTYLFANLPPGSYVVVFDTTTLPTGYAPTTQNAPGSTGANGSDASPITGATTTITLTAGQNDLNWDMGIVRAPVASAALGDKVWYDNDRDGRQDAGEPGVGGVTVILRNTSGAEIARTTTAADGTYLFDNLAAGSYVVVFDTTTLPAGYKVTTQNASGATPANGSDANPTTGATVTITLVAGQRDLDWDMGIVQPLTRLRVTKVANVATSAPGGAVLFVVRVTNVGAATARNVSVCDTPPTRMTFAKLPAGGRLSGGRLCFTIASLARGKSKTYRIPVLVSRSARNETLTNRVSVTASNAPRVRTSAGVRVVGGVLGAGSIPAVTG
jgi:uncharacterized repeat protein (TIGR01451 family)